MKRFIPQIFKSLISVLTGRVQLLVEYRGEPILLNARIFFFERSLKLNVEVNGQSIIFAPDEEQNYRAVINSNTSNNGHLIDTTLLKAIADKINSIVKQI